MTRLRRNAGMWGAACALLLLSGIATGQDRRAMIDRCRAATALVDLGVMGSGSAFCVHERGLFITNWHVVASALDAERLQLVLNPDSADEQIVEARLVSFEEEFDLALLQARDVQGLKVLKLGDADDIFETMPVTTFGYPFGRLLAFDDDSYPAISVSTARVSAFRRVEGKLRALQIDGPLNPGNSGGPVVDETGAVVGVAVATIPGTGLSFAIPVSTLREFLERPGLIVRQPDVRYVERAQPAEFEVEVIAFDDAAGVDELVLEVSESEQSIREVQGQRDGAVYRFTVPLVAEPGEDDLLIGVRQGDGTSYHRVPNRTLELGTRTLQLLEVRRIERRADRSIVTTTSGDRFAGSPAGFEALLSGIVTEPSAVEQIDVILIGGGPEDVIWRVRALQDGKKTAELQGAVLLTGAPIRVDTDTAEEFLVKHGDWDAERQRLVKQLAQAQHALPRSIEDWEATRRTQEPQWVNPQAVRLSTVSGATLTRQDDGSYFVEGANEATDTYELDFRLPFPIQRLTGVRLDVLTDDRLPEKGVGRGGYANFVLNDFEVSLPGRDQSDEPVELPIVRATTDYEQLWSGTTNVEWPIEGTVDELPRTGWAVYWKRLEPHTAVYEIGEVKVESAQADTVRVVLRQDYGEQHTIGRFRLSFTNSPGPLIAPTLPEHIEQALATPRLERSDEQAETLKTYFTRTYLPLQQAEARLAELDFQTPALPVATQVERTMQGTLPEEVTIDVWVDGVSDLYIFRQGMVWDHHSDQKPGRPDELGKYLLVNGQKWYPEWLKNSAAVSEPDQSEGFAMPLGPPVWEVEVVSIGDPEGRLHTARGNVTPAYGDGELKLTFSDPAPGFGAYRVRLTRPNPSNSDAK